MLIFFNVLIVTKASFFLSFGFFLTYSSLSCTAGKCISVIF